MKVTVFGATGAIGRIVVDDLLEAGHDVVAYVRNPDKVPPHWPTASTSSSEPSPTRPPSTMPSAAGKRSSAPWGRT